MKLLSWAEIPKKPLATLIHLRVKADAQICWTHGLGSTQLIRFAWGSDDGVAGMNHDWLIYR